MAKTMRFPAELEEAIRILADREDRSFHAQVLRMLREWLDQHGAASNAR